MFQLKRVSALACGVLLAFCAAATEAAADNYGAIAFSHGSGARGYSYDYPSQEEAEERALQECGRGCEVVVWFVNACGALAVGAGNGYGYAWAASRREAEASALSFCQGQTSGCGIAVWTCTTR